MPPELQIPAYQHLLINHIPIIGLAFAALSLGVALLMRNRPAQLIALGLVCVSAASMVVVNRTGHEAFEQLRTLVDDPGAPWMDAHLDRAEKATPVFYALAVLALVAALLPRRWPRIVVALTVGSFVLALVCFGLSAWIAKAGGQIRHPELRASAAPSPAPSEHHH
ncbi:MAG TPA: hypothetical protein VEO95_09765 [Chthoniobacteraceae bacterium]|nr:hypothetical protein [Chthoniobacteraceae bacterium]